jgi:DNA-binding transcriptional LysR family regulator
MLKLTDVGQVYYTRCKQILGDYEEATRDAQDAQEAVRGVLRVAAPTTFGAMHLGGVVASYLSAYPDVAVEIMLGDRYVDLLADGIDVAIRIGRLKDSELIARRLAPCRMMFCAAPSFLARQGTPKTVTDLCQAPRLVFSEAVSPGDWTLTGPDGSAHTIDGPARLSTNNMQMLLAAAVAGTGIAYGPSFVFGGSVARGDLVVLMSDFRAPELAIHAVYPTKRHLSLKLRRFIDHLSASFGDTPPWDRAL